MRCSSLPLLLLVGLVASSCRGTASAGLATSPASSGRLVQFVGMCDASGGVPMDSRRFLVADDEGNVLRVYDAHAGAAPLLAVDVSTELGLVRQPRQPRKVRPDKPRPVKHRPAPETDIEAATRVGDRALWLTSHARDADGTVRPERVILFATTLPSDTTPVQVVGQPYHQLMEDLLDQPTVAGLGLAEAMQRPAEEPGGLNIEGMTSTPDDGVLIGFRNPVPRGHAVVVHLLNPLDVLKGAPPQWGTVSHLDLGGLGVRALSWWRGSYLILAGSVEGSGPSLLYTWPGPGHVPKRTSVRFGDLNPEGFFTPEDLDEFLVLSDDGTRLLSGRECKKVKQPQEKSFRGVWVRLDPVN